MTETVKLPLEEFKKLYAIKIRLETYFKYMEDEKSESNVVWADDGQSVFFLSARSGSSQIWQQDLQDDRGVLKDIAPTFLDDAKEYIKEYNELTNEKAYV